MFPISRPRPRPPSPGQPRADDRRIRVHDPEAHGAFTAAATALFAQSDGEFVVRARECETLEGETPDVVVVQRFPDAASAQAFYDSPGHQQALKSAGGAFTREVVIVEGA
ncbi:DUF1330 domain-containing protein [Candidatus Palauibacter sp.]|uniref:DUF1330 domain-containing protein n=1 Tax=Candidatus Palauibacter sp. TaxID=3101350 RepID=UPI003AF25BBA